MNLPKVTGKTVRALLRALFRSRPSAHPSLEKLQNRLQYRFRNPSLLSLSLTHRSHLGSDDKNGMMSNERLEFLGDAVVNCLVTEHLYQRFPQRPEGQLSKIKSLIVSRKILGEVALSMNLGDYMILGVSERKSGGRKRKSILSNAFEAVTGAMYLDGDLDATRKFLSKFLFSRIDEFLADERHVNFKSKVLEMAQRDGFGIPRYVVLGASGPEHAKQFTVGIEIAGVALGKGKGSNKKIAQQNAAQQAIENYDAEKIKSLSKGEQSDELLSD